MTIKTHGLLQGILFAIQPVLYVLPVNEAWQPVVHAVAAGISAFLGIHNHGYTPTGAKIPKTTRAFPSYPSREDRGE